MGYVLLGLLAFVLFRFIFRFVIPVYRTTKQVRKKFREFETRQQEEEAQQQGFYPENGVPPKKERPKSDRDKDYIEFEEVSGRY